MSNVLDEVNVKASPTQLKFILSKAAIVVLRGPQEEGKCHAKGTPILKHNGVVVPVEDIKIGDLLMGDDSGPREVLSLGQGRSKLYEVVPVKGESFTVNGEHILSLKTSGVKSSKKGKVYCDTGTVVNISVNDYLKKSSNFKARHMLYKVPVQFGSRSDPGLLDHYFLGLWLGDGHTNDIIITTADIEIVDFIHQYGIEKKIGVVVRNHPNNKSSSYFLSNGNRDGKKNKIRELFRNYNLLGNKHIPIEYKTSSRNRRLLLLAGLIDSGGRINKTGYQIIQKNKKLAADTVFLCRSLGFDSRYIECEKGIKSSGFKGNYYRIYIYGDCSVVPVLLPRKKLKPRKSKTNVLVTSIRGIIPRGLGDYYGFTINHNHLYLLGDFTVTHNTWAGPWRQIIRYENNDNQFSGLLIRDTLENILSKTVIDIKRALEPIGSYPIVRDKKHMTYKNYPDFHVELVGMNDRGSLNRIQGGGYNDVWVEEAAPVFERGDSGASMGVPMEAFLQALSRASRQGEGQVGVTMNPGSEDHWTYSLFVENPLQPCKEWPYISTELHDIPPGENKHVTDRSRSFMKAAYSVKGMEEYYRRYILGQSSYMLLGKPVVPTYDESVHLCREELFPIEGCQVIRLWDGGLNPTCTFCQITPMGFFHVLDCLMTENEGVKQLLDRFVIPLLIGRKYAAVTSWRDIGDPAMIIREQSNSEFSAAVILQKTLGANFECGEKWWEPRRRAVIELCAKRLGIEPQLKVSKTATIMNQALRGGWHYATNAMGEIKEIKGRETLPVKDKSSHPGDTLGHGLPIIFPRQRPDKQRKRREPPRAMFSRLARQEMLRRPKGGRY